MVQPHTCLSNEGKEGHAQLSAPYLAHCILGLVDEDSDVLVSMLIRAILSFTSYTPKYGKVWCAKQLALEIQFVEVVGRRRTTGFLGYCVQWLTTTPA